MEVRRVNIAIARKLHFQGLAWPAGFAASKAVAQDEIKFRCIERLAGTKEFTRQPKREKLRAAAGRAVQEKHRVADAALGVARGRPERAIMDFQLRQQLAGGELLILNREIALDGIRINRRIGGQNQATRDQQEYAKKNSGMHPERLASTAEEGQFNVSHSERVGHVMLPLSSNPMNLRLLLPFLAAAVVATPLFPATAAAQSTERRAMGPDTIVVLPISGEITKAQHIFIRRALKLAERANAKAVILDLDTYGGDLSATGDIQKALLSVKLPTYTFINTNAGSAGALISLATKQIWMAPVSTIGAAAPVSSDGQDLQATMREKVTSYFSARARSVAEQQGHNPDIAEAFMNKEREVKIGDEIISPKGTLLTLNANSAARWINGKPVLAQGIATSLADLVKQANIDGPMIRLEPTGFEKIAQLIASLAPLFLLGGLVCAYLEFKIPGATLPGVLAVVFFGLFFGGHYLAGLAGFEIIALFLLGVMLILAELLFFPGVILPAVIGAGLMLVAIVLAMADRYPSQPMLPSLDQLALPLINLGLALAFAALAITILMSILPKTSLYNRFVLNAAVEGGSAGPLVAAGSVLTGLGLGLAGVTRTPLRPAGKAQFGDTIVDVVSEGGFVEAGVEVHIEQIEGARVMVATKRAAAPDMRA